MASRDPFQPFNCYSSGHKFTLSVYAVHFKLKIQYFVSTWGGKYGTKQLQEEMRSRPVPQTFLKGSKLRDLHFWKVLGLDNQLFMTNNKNFIPLSMLHQSTLSFRLVSIICQYVQVREAKVNIGL